MKLDLDNIITPVNDRGSFAARSSTRPQGSSSAVRHPECREPPTRGRLATRSRLESAGEVPHTRRHGLSLAILEVTTPLA